MRLGALIVGMILLATAAPAVAEILEVGPAIVEVPRGWRVGFLHGAAPSATSDLSIINAVHSSERVTVMIGLGQGGMMEVLREELSPRERAGLRKRTVHGRPALRGVVRMKPDPDDSDLVGPDDAARECLFIDYGTHHLGFYVFYEGKLPAALARDVERMLAARPARR